ncbi:vacuolar ATPase assembly integral membrane protein VMA21 homolog [Onthophagus taurus]|uniref:vacuolar ATPase assembly integral membrane protein VMA21 homolog n=1 Tax=Onthophagus taurus TaxID=166361 RepID=UPI000C203F83|nr:vacuolar ATPase assembly integral membrane protein VMA21 homolog [Onthophagus taurus]
MVEPTMFNVFKTVFYYSIFILLAPISSFFLAKVFFFDGVLGTSNVTSNVWSAVIAVVVLHIALGLYIYKAYSDQGKTKPDKDDKMD